MTGSKTAERLAAAGVILAAAAMVYFTWDTWPDPVNDSGRELYVAWQLAAGKVLYRDVGYFNGPLSPYLNAAWFALTGPGIANLQALNAAVFAAIGVLTWRLVRAVAGWLPAAASAFMLVTILAFGPLTSIGSFTYLLPYSHEMTHGLLLVLLLLLPLDRLSRGGGSGAVVATGFLFGLITLTKPEFVIAGAASIAVVFGIVAHSGDVRRVARLAPLLLVALVPPALAWGALSTAMPGQAALEGILGSWRHLTNRAVTDMPYFRMFMGLDQPMTSVIAMLKWSLAWFGAFALAIGAGRVSGRFRRWEGALAAVLAVATTAILTALRDTIPWMDAFRPLPLVVLAVLVWALLAQRLRPPGSEERSAAVLAAAGASLALALMLKMILYARVWHYGFALGMPGAMIAVAAAVRVSSDWTRRAAGSVLAASGVVTGILAGTIVGHLDMMASVIATRVVSVGEGGDAFRADSRGVVVQAALDALGRIAPENATLAVLPDGVMLSYLARRPNSTPYVIGNPVDVAIFGEDRMLEAYKKAPPDFIAVFACDTSIYGPQGFGQGYAETLARWIDGNYDAIGVARDGQAPGDPFQAMVLRRRETAR